MAQPSASPTPNVLKPPANVPPALTDPLFYPRKEFLRDQQRIFSSFSLLTLAGQGSVRLYSFPDSVINGLRRLFEQQSDILGCRETAGSLFEFTLDTKPWANIRSLSAERLIVSILSVLYQYGYSFLSTVEYAREQDDRIALAFSRPTTAPANSSIPAVPSGSASTLPQAGPMLFAISFPSTALLRVIEPPLQLTPGILQAVRNAWPRGISSEKKVGDSYEFKLKGYRCAFLSSKYVRCCNVRHYRVSGEHLFRRLFTPNPVLARRSRSPVIHFVDIVDTGKSISNERPLDFHRSSGRTSFS